MITPESAISISMIFAFSAFLGTIMGFVNSWRNHAEKKTNERLDIEKQFVKINIKLDELCGNISELLKRYERVADELQDTNEHIISIQEKIDVLSQAKDDHEKRIKDMEVKVR